MARKVDFMPQFREKARQHPDFTVTNDGAVQLKSGVEQATLTVEE